MENETEVDNDNENNLEEDDINDTETNENTQTEIGSEVDGISRDNWQLLEKVKSTQRKDHLKGTTFGSPTANDRLMKELRDIFKSEHYKKGNLYFKFLLINFLLKIFYRNV